MPRDFFSPQSRKPVASERQESQFSSLSGSSLTFGGEAWGRGGKKACDLYRQGLFLLRSATGRNQNAFWRKQKNPSADCPFKPFQSQARS